MRRLDLYFLDECGFSPTLPTGYSWTQRNTRRKIPYENPQGRRVNALVAYNRFATGHPLRFLVRPRTLTSRDVLGLLRRLPSGARPCVVVLDNVAIHTSRMVRQALPELRRRGLKLFYLPSYSPELNEIESVFGVIKNYGLPERSYSSLRSLVSAVRCAFRSYRRHATKS